LVYTIRFFYPQVGQPLPIPPQLAVPNVAAKPVLPPASPPAPAVIKTPTPLVYADKDMPGIVTRNPEELDLNFDYSLAGKSDNIVPLKVYDNGIETNFQFANDNLVIPTISIVDPAGKEQPLNYIIRDGYVVVPTAARQFSLRLADGLICVFNNKAIALK
jgi:hypothetical protein